MRFEIIYYGYGMTPRVHVLPEGTSEEVAREVAAEFKADPHRGFTCLQKVEEIDI